MNGRVAGRKRFEVAHDLPDMAVTGHSIGGHGK
jgi:hypothetical protein